MAAALASYRGDLRRLRKSCSGDVQGIEEALQEFTGIGPNGAAIFCREVQGVWTELRPYVDPIAAGRAARLGLPKTPAKLAALVPRHDVVRLVAACVRAGRDQDVADAVTRAEAGG